MKCATLAMLVLSGAKRLLTRPSCSEYSDTSPCRSVSGRTATHCTYGFAVPMPRQRKSAARWLSLAGGTTPRRIHTTALSNVPRRVSRPPGRLTDTLLMRMTSRRGSCAAPFGSRSADLTIARTLTPHARSCSKTRAPVRPVPPTRSTVCPALIALPPAAPPHMWTG
jgi:hypothetical protein